MKHFGDDSIGECSKEKYERNLTPYKHSQAFTSWI